MEIAAALTSGHAVAQVLGRLGLPLDLPDLHPAGPPPRREMYFGDDPPGSTQIRPLPTASPIG
jgi:hypothetical protein